MTETYYSILGLTSSATTKQIRERFLKLARERHPDRYTQEEKQDAEIEFQKITEAYNVLHDPARRRKYDQEIDLRSHAAAAPTLTSQAARVYLKRGIDALKKKHYKEAVENLENATQENPRDAEAWHYLAQVYSQRSSWLNKGLAASAKACELAPMNAEYLKLAGRLAAQAGVTSRAAKYYHDALTFGGEDAEVRQALKKLMRSKGRGGS